MSVLSRKPTVDGPWPREGSAHTAAPASGRALTFGAAAAGFFFAASFAFFNSATDRGAATLGSAIWTVPRFFFFALPRRSRAPTFGRFGAAVFFATAAWALAATFAGVTAAISD